MDRAHICEEWWNRCSTSLSSRLFRAVEEADDPLLLWSWTTRVLQFVIVRAAVLYVRTSTQAKRIAVSTVQVCTLNNRNDVLNVGLTAGVAVSSWWWPLYMTLLYISSLERGFPSYCMWWLSEPCIRDIKSLKKDSTVTDAHGTL